MKFTFKSISQYGTAYYEREGFKQTIALPSAHLVGDPPKEIEINVEGAKWADKAAKTQTTGLAKALKDAPDDVRKQARAAGRQAEKDALAGAGISL